MILRKENNPHPVVRIIVDIVIDGHHNRQPGSGFFPAGWTQTILTARHVLKIGDRMAEPGEITVCIKRGNCEERIAAWDFVYTDSDNEPENIALVRLVAPVHDVEGIPLMEADQGEEVSGVSIWGYPEGKDITKEPWGESLRGQRCGNILVYDRCCGRGGMSGGPLHNNEGAWGLHSCGEYNVNGENRGVGAALRGSAITSLKNELLVANVY